MSEDLGPESDPEYLDEFYQTCLGEQSVNFRSHLFNPLTLALDQYIVWAEREICG